MAEAGVRYYEKVLNRNIALREISGDDFLYSAKGNVNYLIRNKSLPLTMRKSALQKFLNEKNSSQPATVQETPEKSTKPEQTDKAE